MPYSQSVSVTVFAWEGQESSSVELDEEILEKAAAAVSLSTVQVLESWFSCMHTHSDTSTKYRYGLWNFESAIPTGILS